MRNITLAIIGYLETEDDHSGDDMEKVCTDRHSSVDEGTEQDNSELAGGEMVPVHLWERLADQCS